MKKLLALTISSMFLLSAVGWTFNNNLYSQKSLKSSICSVDNTNKVLSYTSKATLTNLTAPKAKMTKAKKPTKKLIHKSKTITKKTVHKVGKKTITTIETTPVKP